MSIQRGELRFDGPGGSLFARFSRPNGPCRARVALIHGYGEHSGRHQLLLDWLAERQIAAHAVDLRGQGRSEGRRGAVHQWGDYLADVAAFAASDAVQEAWQTPLFFIGHSHGGLVLAAAVQRRWIEPHGVVLSAPYFGNRAPIPAWKSQAARLLNPIAPALRLDNGLKHEWMSRDREMIADSHHDELIVRTATPRWFLGCRQAQPEVLRRAPEFRSPLLVLQGEDDPISDPADAERFYNTCGSSDRTLKLYPHFLHELFREREREQVFASLHHWLLARLEITRP